MTVEELQELLDGYPRNAKIIFREEDMEDNFTIAETELRVHRGKNYVIATIELTTEDMDV